MDLFGDFTRGLGVLGDAVTGNTQPLQGAVSNTLGIQPNVLSQALQQAQQPGYRQAGYSTPLGPLAQPVQALQQGVGRVAGALR